LTVVNLKCKPNPKQQIFLRARKKHIGYGGARAGGKSWAARMKAVLLACRYKVLKILLLRRTYPELEANHILPLQQMLKGIATYVASKRMFIFPNGSFIKLGFCKYESDALQYQGHEYDVIIFEEATLFTEFQMTFIATCARNTRTDFTPRIYYTCNPGGVGHGYIKRIFIDREYLPEENPDDYEFIQALIYDNQILMKNDPGYIKILDALPEELRKAHRDGDWDALSGQYFKEFRRDIHVIDPFIIPNAWDRYVTIDYGLDMLAAYWIAVDFFGSCYVYRELYKPDFIISQAAEMILSISKNENIQIFYAPPDMDNRRQDTGKSASSIFIENGLVPTMTKNDRVHGWLAMKEMMAINKVTNKPKIMFFSTCTNLIKSLPLLQRDDKNPNDISTTPHDITHGPDAIRYFTSAHLELPEDQLRPISGTFYRGELLMKGYSSAYIRKLENKGLIRLVG